MIRTWQREREGEHDATCENRGYGVFCPYLFGGLKESLYFCKVVCIFMHKEDLYAYKKHINNFKI